MSVSPKIFWRRTLLCLIPALLLIWAATAPLARAQPLNDSATAWDTWTDATDEAVVDAYGNKAQTVALPPPADATREWKSREAVGLLDSVATHPADGQSFSARVGTIRARAQQALVLEMADAVRHGDVARAQVWRARLTKPRGASSTAGAMVLQTLPAGATQRGDASRELVREAITWQTTRARQLLDAAVRSTAGNVPMPGRLDERLTEAMALSDLPNELRTAAGLPGGAASVLEAHEATLVTALQQPWNQIGPPIDSLRRTIEATLPSLLTDSEKSRRERLLLKLLALVPREYSAGVRDGQVSVPLEYREAVAFTAQARQMIGELAPLWLSGDVQAERRAAVNALEAKLAEADGLISRKAPAAQIEAIFTEARGALEGPLCVTLRRSGRTKDIVEEVMLEVRSLLNQSLAAGLSGKWAEAERLRLEAYTTFDPDLESRLLPRDPQLAREIEQLLLDGVDQPGVKVLLDRRTGGAELEAAYARVSQGLEKASALLKSGVDPTAAAINAGSIVLREGLEGLLVIIAILAGLRGDENRRRRRLMWGGILLSGVATAITYILSQTILSRLSSYSEIIEAITALMAIAVLLLITNWLFHQIYWNQWVTSLKARAADGESPWQLLTVGFLIGYREGFETVLFLQNLVLDVGGGPVGIGVGVGLLILVACGFAALVMGLRLPYFKLLMLTALLIGVVLMAFVGNGVRAMQTVGWLPVHRVANVRWPAWLGQWLGVYNTWETVIGQVSISAVVIGTWRISRWKAKRAAAQRRSLAVLSGRLTEDASCETKACEGCLLHELGVGCRGEVIGVTGDNSLRQRLLEMGFCNGAKVEVIRRAPPGEPIEFKLRGNHLSLHDEQARHVQVSLEE